jgi:basic membrane protein A
LSSSDGENANDENGLLKEKITRRKALSTAAKAAIGVAAVVVIGGGAYEAYQASKPPSGSSVNNVLKIGFIHFGTSTDLSWDSMAHAGAVAANQNFGNKIQIQEVELVDYTQDASVMEDFASRGYNMIWSHSGGYEADTIAAAKKHPDILYVNSGAFGSPTTTSYPTNFVGVDLTTGIAPVQYVLGALAAKLTKTNKVASIQGENFPTLIIEGNAFKLGARSVNPNIMVNTSYAGTWIDPSKGKAIADSLSSQGYDVFMEEADTTGNGVITASLTDNFLVFHSYYPAQFLAPSNIVSGTMGNFDLLMKKVVGDALNGSFKGGQIWSPSMKDGYFGIQPYGTFDTVLSADNKKFVNDLINQINSGSLTIPLVSDHVIA